MNMYGLTAIKATSTLFVPLFYLSLKKNLDLLRIFSGISLFSVILLPLVLFIYNFTFNDYISSLSGNSIQPDYSFSLSNFILAMCCQMNVTIFVELKKKTRDNLILISTIGPIIALSIYSLVGFLGYRFVGDYIGKKDIISMFATADSKFMSYLYDNNIFFYYFNKFLVVLALISLFGCFPIQLFPATQTLLSLDYFKKMEKDKSYYFILIPMFLVMITVNSIPSLDLNILFGILGAVISNYLSFLIPFGYYAILKWKGIRIKSLIAITIMLLSITYSIYEIVNIVFSISSEKQENLNDTVIGSSQLTNNSIS